MIGGPSAIRVVLLLIAGAVQLSVAARVDYERAVERTRYQFVIGNTKPFDEAYPRAVFEKRVARELAEERVLKKAFGLTVTPELLAQEFDRIEKSTKAPDQWEAIKTTLKNDRRLIEEVFCRPLLVHRALRAKFAFDQKIHAGPHQQAREARAAFLAGKTVPGAKTLLARRKSESGPTTEELLGKAKEEASVPRVLSPPESARQEGPLSLDPEVAAVFEKELKKPGDVTTILEEREQFEVFRLLSITDESWKLETIRFPKLDFDTWLEGEIRSRHRREQASEGPIP